MGPSRAAAMICCFDCNFSHNSISNASFLQVRLIEDTLCTHHGKSSVSEHRHSVMLVQKSSQVFSRLSASRDLCADSGTSGTEATEQELGLKLGHKEMLLQHLRI